MSEKFAIIGGTGVYDPDMLDSVSTGTLDTFYGPINYISGTYK